jgi:hypothetical protein
MIRGRRNVTLKDSVIQGSTDRGSHSGIVANQSLLSLGKQRDVSEVRTEAVGALSECHRLKISEYGVQVCACL